MLHVHARAAGVSMRRGCIHVPPAANAQTAAAKLQRGSRQDVDLSQPGECSVSAVVMVAMQVAMVAMVNDGGSSSMT